MVTALETEFSIRVPDSDFKPRKFDSIASIEAYVQSRS
jgi:acyl carrier protein